MTPLAESFDFTGRRVLITGAANGFGQAAARRFHAQGASLVLADIEAEPVKALAAQLGAQAFVFDQADAPSIGELAAAVGTVDVLINNAGALVAKPLLDTSEAEARHLIDTDFLGVFLLTQHFGRLMVAQGRGVIVSVGSQTAFCGGENRGIYAAAKAAVSQLTRAAAIEWGPHGVRVVCLAPGRSITRMTQQTAAPGYSGDRGLSRVPLGRWGSAQEIADLIVFLASDAAAYIAGETLIADGGYVIG
ncbi:MAG: SDR family oxidoreductase [Betaproteobacteria bacterium]|nr:SDR family oxidoreductase [Betaproteobacteria bacterium]